MTALEVFSSNYLLAKKQLDAVILRQKGLVSNLANAETPNYKRVDLQSSFEDQLAACVEKKDFQALSQLEPQLSIDSSISNVGSNGNNVEIDRELLKMNENSLRHEFLLKIADDSIKRIRSAIIGSTGGGGSV